MSWNDMPEEVAAMPVIAEGSSPISWEVRSVFITDGDLGGRQFWYLTVGTLFGSQTVRFEIVNDLLRALGKGTRATHHALRLDQMNLDGGYVLMRNRDEHAKERR